MKKKEKSREEILREIELERNKVLANRSIHGYYTYDMWMDAISKAENYKEIIGLLHRGLDEDVKSGDLFISDAICIYFDYAYGYDNYGSFRNPEIDSRHEYSVSVLDQNNMMRNTTEQGYKQIIAKKALTVLCQKFLKDIRSVNKFKEIHDKPSWWNMIMDTDSKIFPKVIDFFSLEKNIQHKVNSHTDEILIDFMYKLSTAAWDCHFLKYKKIPQKLIEHRDVFINVLYNLGELGFLVKNWELLAREDVEYITKLATNVDDIGETLSLEEALLKNRKIAEAYVLIRKKIELSEKVLPLRKEILENQEGAY
ncbi:MAG: hypothetical protein AB1333_01430 [Patescibacteria group bacterium]